MTVVFLIVAAACFLLDAVGVRVPRIALTPLGLFILTVLLVIANWPTEPFVAGS